MKVHYPRASAANKINKINMLTIVWQGGSVLGRRKKMIKQDNTTLGLIHYFMRAYPGRSALMVAFLLLSGFAEGIGVVTLLPLLEITTGNNVAAQSTLGGTITTLLAAWGVAPTLPNLLLLIVAGMTLKGVFTLFAMKEVGYTVAHVMTDMRLQLIRALLAARWSYFVSQPAGRFANAISSETVIAARVYQVAAQLMALVLQVIVYMILVVLVSWEVALLGLVAGALVAFIFRGLIDTTRQAGEQQTQLLNLLTARLTDALQGIKPIKAMARESQLLPLLEAETQGLNESAQNQVWSMEALRVLQEPLLVIVIAVGLYAALTYGSQSFTGLMVVVFLFYRLLNRIHSIQQVYQAIAQGESAFWSIRRSIAEADAVRETSAGLRNTVAFNRELRLESVQFNYGAKSILRDVSLTIPAGRFVAIIGPSGAGKTTIIDLLIGLIEPGTGEIRVDGVPLREIDLQDWRNQIGYVPQEIFLFHDTILRNISLGDDKVTRQDAQFALRAAEAWDFVSELPQGLDTVVGERGAKLSGGQRQRISIARALVRRPKLLILDEVTTSLDPESEMALCKTLRNLAGEVTIVAVSHQPALIDVATTVYRLESGVITVSNL